MDSNSTSYRQVNLKQEVVNLQECYNLYDFKRLLGKGEFKLPWRKAGLLKSSR